MMIMNPRIIIKENGWFHKLLKRPYSIDFVAAVEGESATTRYAYDRRFYGLYLKNQEMNEETIDNFIQHIQQKLSGSLSIHIMDHTGVYKKDTLVKLERQIES